MVNYVLFYHYTSQRGLREIIESGHIKNSSPDNNHTHFGQGTYGTSMPPWRGQDAIAENNWRRHGVFYIRNGKVRWALEVKIPRNKVQKIKCKRDILLHHGPVYLDHYEWKQMKVPYQPTPSPPPSRSPSPSPPPVPAWTRPVYESYSNGGFVRRSPPAVPQTYGLRQDEYPYSPPISVRPAARDSPDGGWGWFLVKVVAAGAAFFSLCRLFS